MKRIRRLVALFLLLFIVVVVVSVFCANSYGWSYTGLYRGVEGNTRIFTGIGFGSQPFCPSTQSGGYELVNCLEVN